MATRSLYRPIVLGLTVVLICCVLAPFIMLYSYGVKETGDNFPIGMVKLRKPLLVDDTKPPKQRYSELEFQIAELQRIKVQVRNEMRELEKKRNEIIQVTEKYKTMYYQLQTQLHKGDKQLNILQSDLAKAGHKLYAATPPPNNVHTDPLPIYILSETKGGVAMVTNQEIAQRSYDGTNSDSSANCDNINYCINFQQCPLSNHLKFYVYPYETYTPSSLRLKYSKLMTNFVSHLQESHSLTEDGNEACLYIVILGPFEEVSPLEHPIAFEDTIYNLKYWGRDGKNHVLINLLDSKDTKNYLEEFDPLKAILVHNSPTSYHRRNYDVITPIVSNVHTPVSLWKHLPPILPAKRKFLLYFSGEISTNNNDFISRVLLELNQHIKEPLNIILKCPKSSFTRSNNRMAEHLLCDTEQEREMVLRQSSFSIVPITGYTGFIRLNEALKSGTIPIIIGASLLPFDSVIDWSQAAIIISLDRLKEIHYIIRSITDNRILQLRRQGRFIWTTYFSSLSNVLVTIVTILRSRLQFPPPTFEEIQGKSRIYGPNFKLVSPRYQHNYSTYNNNYWNNVPGPTFMFPYTPWDVPLVSGQSYSEMSDNQLKSLPPHVLQASGITGPYFENYLLGDQPDEYFTVVILTYKREEIVMESIQSLNDIKFLSKVIVIWNDIDKNPYEINWPEISVPVEVIWADKNSLNNRFLPYDSIKTEAVLSLDDDVYLRHDEIQFAFRVWRENRERLVGFPGRFHAFDVHNRNWLYNSNYTCELSMVLTGAAFYHKYYSFLYSYWQPQPILEMVDNKMNCEDIAMNFLISHITRKPPLKVTSRWTFQCTNCPDTLSQSNVHFKERHDCMNTLTEIYGYIPLLYTQYRLDSVLFKTRLPSHFEKCYQYV